MNDILGRVVAASGSEVTAAIAAGSTGMAAIRIGALVKIPTADADAVVGAIRKIELRPGAGALATVELLGTLATLAAELPRFALGVSRHPTLEAQVLPTSETDLAAIYTRPTVDNVRIATLYDDPTRPAFLAIDELLAEHFAVVGTSGSGKSCAVILILFAILAGHPNAHIVVIDPHSEYAPAFGDKAEVINIDNLDLPFWLFDFEEAAQILVRGGTMPEQESQAMILKDAMTRARRHAADQDPTAASLTVDTPVPFHISDVVRFIDEAMGKLDNPDTAAPYLRLKLRIDSLRNDSRFAFLFSDQLMVRDTMAHVVGRLLRLPANDKPLTILDLSGIPSEIADVVVSLTCRITFDCCRWSERGRMPPVLLVCEEAHRYVPEDERVGFAATTREITRIAKEGRKYGVSLALVSQRPSELSAAALSQCGTILSLRLANDLDQQFVANSLAQSSRQMLAELPSMRTQEAIISGRAVALPMRVRFDDLPVEHRPSSESPRFSAVWQRAAAEDRFLEEACAAGGGRIGRVPRWSESNMHPKTVDQRVAAARAR
jgi:DNA helicase HerA-like ATPase